MTSFLPPPQAVAVGGDGKPVDGPEGQVHYKMLVCGPPGMMKHISGEKKSPADQGDLAGLLGKLNYAKPQVFKF